MNKKLITTIIISYFLSTAGAFASFNLLSPSPGDNLIDPTAPSTGQEDALIFVDPGEPKTESCPLNGQMFTKAEKEGWEGRRPLLIMVENHQEARPQSGLSQADIVYEAVAEGGITRFMAVFYCDAITQDNTIGPVRSARTYFLDWASEYSNNPLYTHVGGAHTPGKANALGQISKYGWGLENDLNQFSLTIKECWRDYNRLGSQVATEHTMYCSTEALWKIAARRGWEATSEDGDLWTDEFESWKFADASPAESPQASTINFEFWNDYQQFAVSWKYDPASNVYVRSNGGQIHLDNNNKKPLQVSVVIAQFVRETGPIDDLKHMLYGTIGTGTATIFQDGKVIKAKWSKKTRLARTIFTDNKGKEVKFSRGKIWIEALPTGTTLDY